MRSLMFAFGVLVLCQFSIAAHGQTGTVRVHVLAAQKPIEDAEVVISGTSHRTDASGTTTVVTGAGNVDITVVKAGFVPVTTSVQVRAGATQEVIVELQKGQLKFKVTESDGRTHRHFDRGCNSP